MRSYSYCTWCQPLAQRLSGWKILLGHVLHLCRAVSRYWIILLILRWPYITVMKLLRVMRSPEIQPSEVPCSISIASPNPPLLILLQFHQVFSSHLVPTLSTRPPLLLFSSLPAERVREHQPHHVSGQPAAGVGSLRLPADQADLRPAGEGVESLCRSVGRAQHPAGDVCQFSPEM